MGNSIWNFDDCAPHYKTRGSNLNNRCRAVGCNESHSFHYCRECNDSNSSHLSRNCPQRRRGHAGSRYALMPDTNKQWPWIQNSLQKLCSARSSEDVVAALFQVFVQPRTQDFQALKSFLAGTNGAKRRELTLEVIPFMATLALEFKSHLPQNLQLLLQSRPSKITLTQRQCCCLLSLAFFDIHPAPARPTMNKFSLRFWMGSQIEKLKAIFHYFTTMQRRAKENARWWGFRKVIFVRKVADFKDVNILMKSLRQSRKLLMQPIISHIGAIEQCKGLLQADFANKKIGGGVLTSGSVQEEIRFLISPECMVSQFLCDVMGDNEAILIVGAETFCGYSGYARSYKFQEKKAEDIRFDNSTPDTYLNGVLNTQLVAFDALEVANNTSAQYSEWFICRELLKLNAALSCDFEIDTFSSKKAFATGNWGCGAFGGDPQLSFMLQWAMCCFTDRTLVYFPFKESKLSSVQQVVGHLMKNRITVGQLCLHLLTYKQHTGSRKQMGLFNFLMTVT